MDVVLIIAHHCILPGAFKGFEEVLDKLHHEMPSTRVASTSLLDLENDLRTILKEDVSSVTLLPYLLLNGKHSKDDVPKVVAKLQQEFSQTKITLLPPLGEWKEFSNMVAEGLKNSAKKFLKKENVQKDENHHLLSVEIDLENRNVLVVGGGTIALRKIKTLIPTGANILVVAPQIVSEVKQLKNVAFKERIYEPLDLRGIFMVFICTDKPDVNAKVCNDAKARRILINNACSYLDGDFIVPARIDVGKSVAVTVSTQGKAPALAKKLKQKIVQDWTLELEKLENEFYD